MATDHSPLGVCPVCTTEIPPGRLLIEYQKANDRAMYAECPSCDVPVHPQ